MLCGEHERQFRPDSVSKTHSIYPESALCMKFVGDNHLLRAPQRVDLVFNQIQCDKHEGSINEITFRFASSWRQLISMTSSDIIVRSLRIFLRSASLLSLLVHSELRAQAAGDGQNPLTRAPEVAGTFYPADPVILRDSINRMLMSAAKFRPDITRPIVGMIAPHAGYEYSGSVAARGYSALLGRKYKTVVILGPSHRAIYDGFALYPATKWQTPLGISPVDTALGRLLLATVPTLKINASAFVKEHSLEDQLPFIQSVFGFETKILPIAIRNVTLDNITNLAHALSTAIANSGDSILIIASSDMSHYKHSSETRHRDSTAAVSIARLDIDRLANDLDSGRCELCGYAGVMTLMLIAERQALRPYFIYYRNSGEVTPDTNRCVGYGAFAFLKAPSLTVLSHDQQQQMLSYTRSAIESLVKTGKHVEVTIHDSAFLEPRGAFVTLNKRHILRGCIGYVQAALPMAQSVLNAAEAVCTMDTRFPKLTAEELNEIEIEVSVLEPLTRVRSLDDIVLGTHGLLLRMDGKEGVFLPQVPAQFGWTKEQFLEQLGEKAGLSKDTWKKPGVKLYTFTAQVFAETGMD